MSLAAYEVKKVYYIICAMCSELNNIISHFPNSKDKDIRTHTLGIRARYRYIDRQSRRE